MSNTESHTEASYNSRIQEERIQDSQNRRRNLNKEIYHHAIPGLELDELKQRSLFAGQNNEEQSENLNDSQNKDLSEASSLYTCLKEVRESKENSLPTYEEAMRQALANLM